MGSSEWGSTGALLALMTSFQTHGNLFHPPQGLCYWCVSLYLLSWDIVFFFSPFFPCSQACKFMHSHLAECREISGCSETHDCASGRQQWQAAHQRGFSLSLCRKVERNNKNKAQTMTVLTINKRIFVFTNSGLGHCKGRWFPLLKADPENSWLQDEELGINNCSREGTSVVDLLWKRPGIWWAKRRAE